MSDYHAKKFDQGKTNWALIRLMPHGAIEAVLEVLEYGAKKYAADSWREVPDAKTRYLSAAFRHLVAHAQGEDRDRESGLTHLAHVATNIAFLIELNAPAVKVTIDPSVVDHLNASAKVTIREDPSKMLFEKNAAGKTALEIENENLRWQLSSLKTAGRDNY